MVAASSSEPQGPRTYGNWRKPSTAGLMGLGTLGTALLLGGLIFVVFMVMAAGMLAGMVGGAIVGMMLLAVLVKDKHDRNLLSRMTVRIAWWNTRSSKAHLYRSGPLGRTPWGTFQLPGLAAASRLSEHTDSYGRPFALLYVPATGHYTVVIGTEPDGAALVDPEQIDVWVAGWGHWLANLGDEPGIEAASVTVETAPDTGTRLRREVISSIDPEAPEFARAVLEEAVDNYPMGSSIVKAYVAVTFSATSRTGGKRRKPDEMGTELAARIPNLTQQLSATGAGAAHPLTAQELCETIRIAYDPASAVLIDEAHAAGETPELTWPDVGPTAHQTMWDCYIHDGALSMTWSMTSAPRGNVQANILSRLLAPHADIARKRVTLLYRPLDAARAASIVEADLRAAEFRQTSSHKPTARDVMATRAARATAAEEASGAGLVNFGLVVTATVTDPELKAEARAAIDNLSATARLRLRLVHGSQDSAFAGALPLGLVLPKHLKIPAELKEQL
ncbi:SCO6880 family protein [Nocardiopsis rhodophaea]|uniref:SCO6880 family protein n=1 Tax=Nocardiopsis rhodophaea TaxID=280238 RepID=UPI0031D1D6CF